MPAPDSPPPLAPKSKSNGLAVAGIGCLLVAVIAVVMGVGFCTKKVKEVAGDFQKNPAKTVALLALKANPEVELVKTDDATGEITIRSKKTGEETTMYFEEFSSGKFRLKTGQGQKMTVDAKSPEGARMVIKGPDGETTVGGGAALPPGWVPAYPGATAQPGGMKINKQDKVAGAFTAHTADEPAKVKEFYESQLKAGGFVTDVTTTKSDGVESFVLAARKDEGKQTVSVLINRENAVTMLVINYEGPE